MEVNGQLLAPATSPLEDQHPLCMRLGGPKTLCSCYREEKVFCPCWKETTIPHSPAFLKFDNSLLELGGWEQYVRKKSQETDFVARRPTRKWKQ
jgi:hypothetical protein